MARSSKSGTSTRTTKARATAAGPKARGAAASTTPAVAPIKQDTAAAPQRGHLRAVEPPKQDTTPDAAKEPAVAAAPDTRFKRQALLDAVCAKAPVKRTDAKTLIDVLLDELGRAIDSNDELVLPPLGKLSIKRRNTEGAGGDVLTIKLKRANDAGAGGGDKETPLAAAGEDS
ncbi:HU family DNA-binding protein [Roseicyclus sp.]|uniref:HU family DNA-binding protein n=1 Tax=Roseicyclus sp. TaxID=1914329 RepID=UPI003F6A9970